MTKPKAHRIAAAAGMRWLVRVRCGRCNRVLGDLGLSHDPGDRPMREDDLGMWGMRPGIPAHDRYEQPDGTVSWTLRCSCGMVKTVRGSRLLDAYRSMYLQGEDQARRLGIVVHP